ncbi:MAG: hypothetical protein KC912_04470 [Proteobacteria bacterium]|nr:hypothetical protein [Pseudomonadota bacterium]
MITSASAPPGDQGGGGGAGLAMRTSTAEKEGVDYGGDDDAAPADVPFEEALMAEAWRPRTRKSEQRQRFTESMPEDDLPDEDEDWVQAIRSAPAPQTHSSSAIDALIQPTAEVVASSLADWARGAFAWGPTDLVWRTLAHAITPAAPSLVDPHGRVLLSRARAGAIGIHALLASPTLADASDPASSGLVVFDLELRARRRRLIAHASSAGDQFEGSLPIALGLYDARAPQQAQRRRPHPAGPEAVAVLRQAVSDLVDLIHPIALVPKLAQIAGSQEEEEDDPLGIAALIAEHTGGAKPPPHRGAAVKAAERLAEQCALGRVQLASAAVVIGEVANRWTVGPPHPALRAALAQLDADVGDSLGLLVEIARAAQTGAVGPKGLEAGFKRAAKRIHAQNQRAIDALASAAASVLSPGAHLTLPPVQEPDPLVDAWAEGRALDAIPWLSTKLDGWELEAAALLTRIAAGKLGLADELARVGSAAPSSFGPCFDVLRDAALISESRHDEVDPLPRAHEATQRRNGLVFAEASLTRMETRLHAEDWADAEHARTQAGVQLYHMGAYAGFSLLARWSPPALGDED